MRINFTDRLRAMFASQTTKQEFKKLSGTDLKLAEFVKAKRLFEKEANLGNSGKKIKVSVKVMSGYIQFSNKKTGDQIRTTATNSGDIRYVAEQADKHLEQIKEKTANTARQIFNSKSKSSKEKTSSNSKKVELHNLRQSINSLNNKKDSLEKELFLLKNESNTTSRQSEISRELFKIDNQININNQLIKDIEQDT